MLRKSNFKTILAGFLGALLVAVIAHPPDLLAGPGLDSIAMSSAVRTRNLRVMLMLPTTADTTAGVNDVAFALTTNTAYAVKSSSAARMSYPCKVQMRFSGSTASCPAITIAGLTPRGNFLASETLSTVGTGAWVKSTKAYDSIQSITAPSGSCNAGSGGDRLLLACSPEIGTDVPFSSANAFRQACVFRIAGVSNILFRRWCYQPSGLTVDTNAFSIDMAATSTQTLRRGDEVFLRYRTPAGL